MAFAEEAGSQTCTVTTEHTLNASDPETTQCILSIWLDCSAMAAGDRLEVRLYEKVQNSSGTIRIAKKWLLSDAQTEPNFERGGFHVKHGWRVTIKQTDGTGRAIPWSLRKVT